MPLSIGIAHARLQKFHTRHSHMNEGRLPIPKGIGLQAISPTQGIASGWHAKALTQTRLLKSHDASSLLIQALVRSAERMEISEKYHDESSIVDKQVVCLWNGHQLADETAFRPC